MPTCLRPALALLAIPALVAAPPVASPGTPAAAYEAYRQTLGRAKALAEVLPSLSREWRQMLASRPAADHPTWLEGLREHLALKDLKLLKETRKGRECTLEGSAIGTLGFPVRVKIVLVQEQDGWKLDSLASAT